MRWLRREYRPGYVPVWEWHAWFAWYPVRILSYWVWWEWVERRSTSNWDGCTNEYRDKV